MVFWKVQSQVSRHATRDLFHQSVQRWLGIWPQMEDAGDAGAEHRCSWSPLEKRWEELSSKQQFSFSEWDRFEAQSKHITFACSLEPTSHFLNLLEIIASLLSSFNSNIPVNIFQQVFCRIFHWLRDHDWRKPNHSVGIHTWLGRLSRSFGMDSSRGASPRRASSSSSSVNPRMLHLSSLNLEFDGATLLIEQFVYSTSVPSMPIDFKPLQDWER